MLIFRYFTEDSFFAPLRFIIQIFLTFLEISKNENLHEEKPLLELCALETHIL